MPSKKRPQTGEEIARATLKRAMQTAAENVERMAKGHDGADERRFADVTVQQKASLILAGKLLDAERAKQESAGPKVFAPILLVPQLKDAGQWEQLAQVVETTGALPPVSEQLADDDSIEVEAVDASKSSD